MIGILKIMFFFIQLSCGLLTLSYKKDLANVSEPHHLFKILKKCTLHFSVLFLEMFKYKKNTSGELNKYCDSANIF